MLLCLYLDLLKCTPLFEERVFIVKCSLYDCRTKAMLKINPLTGGEMKVTKCVKENNGRGEQECHSLGDWDDEAKPW